MIGAGCAHLQHLVDTGFSLGFRLLKRMGSTQNDTARPTYIHTAKRGGKAVCTFLGTLGESFYSTYEELKKQK